MLKYIGIWNCETYSNHRILWLCIISLVILPSSPGIPNHSLNLAPASLPSTTVQLGPSLSHAHLASAVLLTWMTFPLPSSTFQIQWLFRKLFQSHAYLPIPSHSLQATHTINLLFIFMHPDYKLWDKTEKNYLLSARKQSLFIRGHMVTQPRPHSGFSDITFPQEIHCYPVHQSSIRLLYWAECHYKQCRNT